MQVYDYSLSDLIENKKERLFSNDFIWFLLDKLNNSLLDLHIRGVTYGNLVPLNILFLDGIAKPFHFYS